jgi:methylenetetrahydrofolate reductase (NADPH)
MSFTDIFNTNKKVLSFEFFPPKEEINLEDTKSLIAKLAKLNPDFMTVTYGAGGGTREFTKALTSYINNDLKIKSTAHLTCVGHSKDEVEKMLNDLKSQGVSQVLALRGDPPKGETFTPHPNGFSSSVELVEYIKNRKDFSIAVAGYPEKHLEASSMQADIDYLKLKIDSGAEIVITQLFFDSKLFLDFVELCRKNNINVPIVPGLMPIRNVEQVKRFTSMCGASIPTDVLGKLENYQNDAEAVKKYGVELATNIAEELLKNNAPGIHLFTLNKSLQVQQIAQNLASWWD